MRSNKILGITILPETKSHILEKIILYISKPIGFYHIVSLNPENMVISTEDEEFKRVVETAQIKLIDGVGIVLALRWLGVQVGERVTGVGLMGDMIRMASERRLRVLMIGGKEKVAERLDKCYLSKYPEAKFIGLEGIVNAHRPMKDEEDKIFTIVADYKPHFVFVAFGSPAQELWIERHKKEFGSCVVMGVGGAFDYLSSKISRPPVFIQKMGLEWLFRLFRQPWRWRRQMRLLKFLYLVIKN